jgi:hypothetical protein
VNFDIPIFIEELPASGGKPPSFIVRPAFDPAFVQRADKLSRALARLTTDLQNHLHQLGTEPRHESLARWTSRGPLKEATLELRLDLDSGAQKLRLFLLGYQALDRELWFSPALPDIHFEVLPGQQLTAQAGWTDPDLNFWHYRDKDQVEVDFVITRGQRTWGVEVKATATPTHADISGLRRLAAQCGEDFAGGLLIHAGAHLTTLGDPRFLAVPLAKLWEM